MTIKNESTEFKYFLEFDDWVKTRNKYASL